LYVVDVEWEMSIDGRHSVDFATHFRHDPIPFQNFEMTSSALLYLTYITCLNQGHQTEGYLQVPRLDRRRRGKGREKNEKRGNKLPS
jgi:hypothetical protein